MWTERALRETADCEKQFNALYRNAAASCGFSDSAMWVLYYLYTTEETITQQDLIRRMMFPKQTINSAVSGLVKKGLIRLTMIPGTRNKKMITLTEDGKAAAEGTVGRMYAAECRAVESLGQERMEAFLALYHEFYDNCRIELEKEGLAGDE